MEKGYWMLVLHAHLPFVRHPEYRDSFEERWLYEAIIETYLPLLQMFEGLLSSNTDFRITMSLTPPLLCMLADEFLKNRFKRHLEKLIELAEKEVERTKNEPEFNETAKMYLHKFTKAYQFYTEVYRQDLISAFKKFEKLGKLEIITCGATHGFFPLLGIQREAIRAQVKVAVDHHKYFLGNYPRGIWLPECGYSPGDDLILREFGIRFFFVDSHGLLYARPRPRYGIFAPVFCPSGVAVFARDIESSKQVWSSQEGYPGDFDYREFYRDIGYDLEMDLIKPYIHESGIRVNTGIKYYRITGKVDLGEKEPYHYKWALEKAAIHAGNFLFNRQKQVEYLSEVLGIKPIIVSPYDAELFGHWWYEGPDFLNFLFRKLYWDQDIITPITPSEYLSLYPEHQVSVPSLSSWGYKGYNEYWLNGANDWVYKHLHIACERMIEIANIYREGCNDSILERALNQAARELLLAQSSDWAFIMKSGTTVHYAHKRTKEHLSRFHILYEQIKSGQINLEQLEKIENRDNIFPLIDYKAFCTPL